MAAMGSTRSIRASVVDNTVELWVLDEITSFTAQQLLVAFDANPGAHFIINIFSQGGNPFAANALHDRMKQKGVKATARIFGHAASAAAMIACACDRVEIGENSFLMIHEAYGGDQALLDSLNEKQVALFRGKTGLSASAIASMLKAETWMDAKEAKANGFADSIIKEMAIAALYKEPFMENEVKPEGDVPEVKPADPGDEQLATEGDEVEIPVTVPQAVEAAIKGKIVAKVKVSAEMKKAVADLTEERNTVKAQLQERIDEVTALNEKLTTAQGEVTAANSAKVKAEGELATLNTKLEDIGKEVEKLKKAPLAEAEGEPRGGATTPGAGPTATTRPRTRDEQKRDAKEAEMRAAYEASLPQAKNS